MEQRTCTRCGGQITKKPGPGRWPKYCGDDCRYPKRSATKRAPGPPKRARHCKTCGVEVNRRCTYCDDCVCGTEAGARRHYKRREKPCRPCLDAFAARSRNRHASQATTRTNDTPCTECGGPLPPGHWVTCSTQCRHSRIVNSDAYRRARIAQGKRGASLDDRVWTVGRCLRCGDWFTVDRNDLRVSYCSLTCKQSEKSTRRRCQGEAVIERHRRYEIFDRDGWRCQLCGKATKREAAWPDPLMPTIDHIVPVSQGGAHTPANWQCAHLRCNAIKRDGVYDHTGDQLRLIG